MYDMHAFIFFIYTAVKQPVGYARWFHNFDFIIKGKNSITNLKKIYNSNWGKKLNIYGDQNIKTSDSY